MDRLSEAICFAARVFDGMTRKCENNPAILHSLEAAAIAATVTEEPEAVIAAVLHDTVEDAGVCMDEIESLFGARVAALVASETENKREHRDPSDTWYLRKRESIAFLQSTDDLGIKAVYLGDKLSNMRSLYRCRIKFGAELWNMFHQNDPHAHLWYYRSIADALSVFGDAPAYREYLSLIEKTFSEEIKNG